MSRDAETSKIAFTPGEIRVFKWHAVIVAGIVAGIAVAAPKGPAQVLGALGAVALLPVPPLVVLFLRRRKAQR